MHILESVLYASDCEVSKVICIKRVWIAEDAKVCAWFQYSAILTFGIFTMHLFRRLSLSFEFAQEYLYDKICQECDTLEPFASYLRMQATDTYDFMALKEEDYEEINACGIEIGDISQIDDQGSDCVFFCNLNSNK